MTDDTHHAFNQLNSAAGTLAQEIWDKKWGHVADLKVKPVGDCDDIVRELERRCPGFAPDDYKRAIAKGMFGQR